MARSTDCAEGGHTVCSGTATCSWYAEGCRSCVCACGCHNYHGVNCLCASCAVLRKGGE